MFASGTGRADDLLAGPIHGELLGADRLADRARAVARTQVLRTDRTPGRQTRLLSRLDDTRRLLADARARLGAAAERGADVGPAGAWLLDNQYVVEEHVREVRESLPGAYYGELPKLDAGPLAGYPRVYEIATTLIGHTEGRIDGANVELFVAAFQEVAPLAIGELWAVPAMLRLALIESLRRMTIRTLRRLDEVEAADDWAARLAGPDDGESAVPPEVLEEFLAHHPPLTPAFVSRFLPQLRLADHALQSHVWLASWMAEEGVSAEDAAARAHERLALTQVITANSITSLRALGRLHWKEFVERQSVLEATLRTDPAAVYADMTFATRDAYRHVVERVARRTQRAEREVAELAVRLAGEGRQRWPDDVARGHVGYYLVDAGRATLEAATGYAPDAGEALGRRVLRHPNVVLFGGIGAGTLAALAAVLWLGDVHLGAGWAAWLPIVLLTLVPANEIAVGTVNRLVTAFLPPRTLPKLDLSRPGGIPPELRTAVVIPTLFGSVEAVREALDNLEVQFLANREAHLHFAVIGDFTDAPHETAPGDAAIVAAAVDGVHALNARYAAGRADAFYLFHRSRRWNARQGVWMGWERKRGKLAEFNRFLRGAAPDAFSVVVGDVAALRGVRYAITLDADTVLPPDAAPLLVGALAHPLNRAVYDASLGRVVRGYGILQPRVGVSLPSAHRSRFAEIHSGHPGVDPYTTAVSDVYQDLYGEGSFTGKGIYDVDAFEEATHGRFPENTLLSHDLIEGSYARAGLATDIEVLDDYPTRYLTHARRKHRWIRGDWQLLRWLGPTVPGPDGPEPNRLSLLSRWRLFDNLRRSLVEIAQLALLVVGWTVLPGSPLRWTALGLLAIAAPWIVSLLLAALRPPLDRSWRAYYTAVGHDAATSARQLALAVTFLPHQAWLSADAIARSLWRTLVSGRHLLEWQTASQTERAATGTASAVWRTMWPAVALAIGALAVVAPRWMACTPAERWRLAAAALPLVALWIASPAVARALSAPPVRRERRLDAAHRAAATRYALAHWQFFERFVSAETNWLAPDNFQEDPAPVVAMRTSPTNVGLQLLATISAHDLGFIPLERMTERLERAFDALARMRRFRGHFYNWYDLHDLRVLEPAYVSTVDSGNLAGHLIAVRQACLGLTTLGSGPGLDARLRALARQAGEYAEAMDFGLLFDRDRELFSIGYQEATHTLDASSYDLLASEARLASFVAIARNQAPVDHWFRLGRTLTHAEGATALVSWSGSMFEYLMPALVMRTFPLTLLDQTYHGAVRRQVAYAAARSVPWGISESAYNLRDRHLTYQYRAFGVPDLALKRGLGHDLVVAPYASALAAMVDPGAALDNLAALEDDGALGPYGFRDALDFTRPDPGARFALVRNYMAHHVGMSLVALTNVLAGDVWPRRFHADPLVRAAELLLQERIPRRLLLQPAQADVAEGASPAPELERPTVRAYETPDTPQPRVVLLGHLPYTIMVTNAGSGYSRYEGLAVTRWRADATTDDVGQFCYVKDVTSGRVWSATHQPVCAPADSYLAHFATDRATFHRVDGEVETRTEIAVVPADAAEVRRVTVTNNGSRAREVELTSYAEVVLAPPDADRAHPAFSNLFVQTEWHAWCSALFATRRPRSATEASVWCVHVVAVDGTLGGPITYETDRARFVGRGRTVRRPAALDPLADGPLSGTTGAVLDPVVALRARVRLDPGQSATVAFTTLVATTRERAFELADRYDDPTASQRALDLAWTTAQVELRELNVTPTDTALFQDVAGHLLYGEPALGADADERARSRGSQPLLWAAGISGDWPILLATIDAPDGLPTLRQLLSAHQYWRRRGMLVDLVVLDARPPTYLQDLHDRVIAAVAASTEAGVVDQPGGVFVRRAELLAPDVLLLLRTTARVHVACDGRSLGHTLDASAAGDADAPAGDPAMSALRRAERSAPQVVQALQRLTARLLHHVSALTTDTDETPVVAPYAAPHKAARDAHPDALSLDNGVGGLTDDGDYEIRLRAGALPPAPWANVVANPRGGFVVTERGAGFAWAENSYFYRLTPWHNDPVSDPASDVVYLRDEASGDVWSATPAPIRHAPAYTVRHRAGSSTFEHEHEGIASALTLGLAPDEPVKVSLLRLTNRDARPRRLTVTAYVEWTLGVLREHSRHHVQTTFDAARRAILARNPFDPQFAGHVAFCAMSEPVTAHTADRREFLGRNGATDAPRALAHPGTPLSGRVGVGLDPCAALQCRIDLAPGETREIAIALGAGASEADARRLVDAYGGAGPARGAVDRTTGEWRRRLTVVRVRTPQPSFDAMVNRWALYQALACRMWARSALYQSSGAYGFRDQLQDSMAFVYAEPAVARAHVLRAAARQFVEGDVQHWWHPQSGRGVRTRFSDDMAWLPYVVDHYVRVTGDATVLDEEVPFLASPPLAPDEDERYDLPQVADETASVYEHCLRALRRAATTGAHGLPLIGTGDWNDGMNRVGVEGRGESVWLAWFLTDALRRFAGHAEARADPAVAAELRARAAAYAAAAEAGAWDGAWYRRAYFDDGTPLGSAASDECRIDAIAQSWSVISGAGDPARQREAMRSFETHLVREDARLLMLLTPPFDRTPNDPGYIKGYLPGVRENGAQYTHAALWSVLATALSGDGDRAFELFQMINPLTHARTPDEVATYKVEPYVVAADVYTADGQLGRGGWTWYTGSASWLYRVALETILGFTKRGDTLSLTPCVPREWPGYSIVYRYGATEYHVTVESIDAAGDAEPSVTLDGRRLPDPFLPLADDGATHDVRVIAVRGPRSRRADYVLQRT
ncbi:GH36-type glycosyl hydrolase domain-containing protein [Gemmatirosa kalamazoonensis]|uniref:GH36-type glycosyl hydrolase domain-containing protein n=1 Tax=Gemmatirosa kalamazoonensis TaxID=861299 RepID=UPI00046CE91B|nr:glucoamylase family protein [Gemmatirosa kalamazoonensis]